MVIAKLAPALQVFRAETRLTVTVNLVSAENDLKPAVNCQPRYRGRALSPGRYLPTLEKINFEFSVFHNFLTLIFNFQLSFYLFRSVKLNRQTFSESKSMHL